MYFMGLWKLLTILLYLFTVRLIVINMLKVTSQNQNAALHIAHMLHTFQIRLTDLPVETLEKFHHFFHVNI